MPLGHPADLVLASTCPAQTMRLTAMYLLDQIMLSSTYLTRLTMLLLHNAEQTETIQIKRQSEEHRPV